MKTVKKIQLNIPWKKIGLALVVAFFLIFGIMVLHFRMTYHSPTENYHNTIKIEFVWDGITQKGTYDGDFRNTQPNGTGTYTADHGTLTYEGEWEKGLFSGEGKITYNDGSIEEGEFLDGKRNGRVRKYQSEAAYGEKAFVETIYDMNTPYAISETYEKGELSSTKYYVNATPVSEIKSDAKPLTEKMLRNEDYYNTYVSVEGEVEFVGETAECCYFRMKTDSVGMVYGGYDNTFGLTSDQRYIPTLKVGDKVTVYGYYMGISKYTVHKDTECYGNKISKIMPFLAEVDESTDETGIRKFEATGSEMTYDNLLANPYLFNMVKVDDTFVVKNSEKAGMTYTIMGYKEDKPDELYALIYKGDTMDRFATGSKIRVKGFVAGQTKNVSNESRDELIDEGNKLKDIVTYDFTRYPVIQADEIE